VDPHVKVIADVVFMVFQNGRKSKLVRMGLMRFSDFESVMLVTTQLLYGSVIFEPNNGSSLPYCDFVGSPPFA
jgi:hypothetical protein